MNSLHPPSLSDLPPIPPNRIGWPWDEAPSSLPPLRADGSTWPRITVVTPSYNQAEFLEETIRSVLLQGYPNLEYIIMDGGSTDGSVEIIQKYAPWLAYWVSEKDAGQADAINKGWNRATGDAITWLNSDDVLMPGCLETTISVLYSTPSVDFVYGDVYATDADSKILYRVQGKPFKPADILVRAYNPIPQQGFLMKRTLLETVGWLDPEMQFCMDFDYWSRLALHNIRATYVNKVLAHFRQHASAKTSTQYKTRIANRQRIFEKIFADAHLAPIYQQQREIAQAHVMLKAAYIAYKADDATLVRQYAWHYLHTLRQHSSFLGVYLLISALGGRRSLQLAKRLRSLQNSYYRTY